MSIVISVTARIALLGHGTAAVGLWPDWLRAIPDVGPQESPQGMTIDPFSLFGYRALEFNSPWQFSIEAESETAAVDYSKTAVIEARIRQLMGESEDEIFEDGMPSRFGEGIRTVVEEYGTEAVEVLVGLSMTEQVRPHFLAEALASLARMEDRRTHDGRLWLLCASLFHSAALIRDAAAAGLHHLCDRRAITYLRIAANEEPVIELQSQLEQVIARLGKFSTP